MREAFLLEHLGDGDGAEPLAVLLQSATDVIDGQVLLAQGDDFLAAWIGRLGAGFLAAGFEEEGTLRVTAELMHQAAETAGRVAEAHGGLLGRHAFHEISPQGLVLPMDGVGGLEEVATECLFVL